MIRIFNYDSLPFQPTRSTKRCVCRRSPQPISRSVSGGWLGCLRDIHGHASYLWHSTRLRDRLAVGKVDATGYQMGSCNFIELALVKVDFKDIRAD